MSDPRAVPAPGATVHVIDTRPRPIILPGERWQAKVLGPWAPSRPHIVTILNATDEVVRFDRGIDPFRDERVPRTTFLQNYEPVPPQEAYDAEEHLRARFERWARSMNWNIERQGLGYRYDIANYGYRAYLAGVQGLGA